MRFPAFALLAFALPAAALAETVGDRLVRQEIGSYCEQIDPAETNFQCQIVKLTSETGPDVPYLQIRWLKPRSEFSEPKQKELHARVDKLLFRYFRLTGGNRCAAIYEKYDPDSNKSCCPEEGRQPDYSCYSKN